MIIIETWQIVRYYCEIGSLASHLLVSDRGKEIKFGSQAASPISITGSWWWYDTSAISGNLPCLFGSDAWSLSFLRSARLKAWLLASGLTSEPWKIGSKKVGICETIFGSLDPNPSIVSTTGTFSLCQDPKTNCHRKNNTTTLGRRRRKKCLCLPATSQSNVGIASASAETDFWLRAGCREH